MPVPDDENGGQGLTYEQILAFLNSRSWPVTSPIVAEEFGITQQAAYYRLKRMTRDGLVERTKIGQTVLWRPTGKTLD